MMVSDQVPASEDALQRVLRCLEGQPELTLAEFLSRFPASPSLVRRAWSAMEAYHYVRAQLTSRAESGAPLVYGQNLGGFVIESLLASGGMGTVYRASQLALGGRLVALKVLRDSSPSASAHKRFQREATLLASLHHPNLVEVLDYGEDRGRPYFAMELVEGPNLHDELQRSIDQPPRDPLARQRSVVQLIRDVASGLGEVHSAGLVHRDVKPANIVLEAMPPGCGSAQLEGDPVFRKAVLVDFGLVRSVCEGVSPETTMNATPSYASPEQILGGEITARSDVFSLGVTLHDLLTRSSPKDRQPACAGLMPLRELLPAFSPLLSDIVARAVDPCPEWRYGDAQEFAADLGAWLKGQRPRGLESSRTRLRRLRAVILLGISFVALSLTWGFSKVGSIQAEGTASLVVLRAGNSYSDQFGNEVSALDSTLVVGAPTDAESGAAYLYYRVGQSWTRAKRFVSKDAQKGDSFGAAVAMGEGFMAVGAPYTDSRRAGVAHKDAGVVHVYFKRGEHWSSGLKVSAPDLLGGQLYGAALAIRGSRLVVGAPRDRGASKASGKVYVYTIVPETGEVRLESTLWLEHGKTGDTFGSVVATDGANIFVGAHRHAAEGTHSGAVAAYSKRVSGWELDQLIYSPEGAPGDDMGCALSVDQGRLAIGSFRALQGSVRAGRVSVYEFRNERWVLQARLSAPLPVEGAQFGSSLALRGELLAIGSRWDSEFGINSGTVNLFRMARGADAWVWEGQLASGVAGVGDEFGGSLVSVSQQLIVGASCHPNGNSGYVAVFPF